MNKTNRGFIFLTLGVFIILFFSKVFQHGLFFDGLIYSSVSSNMASGNGSFWNPQFSQTIYAGFYEHPPLLFGLQSVFMSVFDHAFFTEKLFSFFTACLTGLFIALIWMQIMKDKPHKSLFWLPVLFWILTPKNSWAYSNNLLENLMGVFTIATIWLLLIVTQSSGRKRIGLLAVAGVLLVLAFLSKGFPGLFPLAFFFLYFLVLRKGYSLMRFLQDTALLIVSAGLVFSLLILFSEAARQGLSNYLEVQVFGSISGKSRVGSRLVLMKNLFNELIPLLLITAIIIGSYWKKSTAYIRENKIHLKWILLFLLIGLSASVPLMISPKLSSFYLICALPYFAILFAVFLSDSIVDLQSRLRNSKIGSGIVLILGLGAVVVGIILTTLNVNTYGRDTETLHDMRIIGEVLPEKTILFLHGSYYDDWTTIAYFQRYLKINFDRNSPECAYHLVPKGAESPANYERLKLNTQKFDILQKIESD